MVGLFDEETLTAAKPGTVAVNKLKPEGFQGLKEWLSEINYLGQLDHENLVKLIGFCLDGRFAVDRSRPGPEQELLDLDIEPKYRPQLSEVVSIYKIPSLPESGDEAPDPFSLPDSTLWNHAHVTSLRSKVSRSPSHQTEISTYIVIQIRWGVFPSSRGITHMLLGIVRR
ncbi:hypothetical protein POM88_009848 [Heracleum sosnowskyi]|uniref:Serine-threonine/tyrosine-protein kinase catalytic domain-containing protein n=1 Tax=Heracleum sosnowskyi TaxID=360622 RepID=A0AAD8JCK0_9APIA|nr:hypothetical protein POM88_009848 [Heracleum sosnowskyi]